MNRRAFITGWGQLSPHRAIPLAVLTLIFVAPGGALACRCIEPKSVRAAYDGAEAVVVAKVLDVRQTPNTDRIDARLWVSRVWKMDIAGDITIVSATTCRYELRPNREYLLFLNHDPKMTTEERDAPYATGICLGNKELPASGQALDWLDTRGRAGRVERRNP